MKIENDIIKELVKVFDYDIANRTETLSDGKNTY